jgi:hypothetical protein
MHHNLNPDDALVKCEGFEQFRKIEVERDSVLFAMLSGLVEQTIRCRRLDVANTFREAFLAKVYKLGAKRVKYEYNRVIDLFDQALEGRLTFDQAREALLDVQSTDVMQELFIQDNENKNWLIERLNDGIPVNTDDEVIIPWFCKTFGIEVCIYWLESHSEYERIEFLSPRIGMIVNIYQRQNEFETETGLLYFADYDEEAKEPRYPNCCLASDLSRCVTKCSTNKRLIPRRSNPSQLMTVQSNSFQTSYSGALTTPLYKGNKETIEGFPVFHIRVPSQAIARLKSNLQEKGYSPDKATHLIYSEPSSSKLMFEPQLMRTDRGVVRDSGMNCLAASEISYSLVQPGKSQTIKLKPLPKQVKAKETQSSDPVTKSLPPASVKLIPNKLGNMHEALNTTDFLVQCEGFVQLRKIELEGDPVLFAMLSGLLEQTIRCRTLDVVWIFRETFFAKVDQLKLGAKRKVQDEYKTVMDLFDQALEGRLTLDQVRVALLDVQSTDVMQQLFIQNNPHKIWLIERLNDGIPVCRDDKGIIPWFCKTFGIEICIYRLESPSEYERVEFLSPRVGMIVNIYQRQNELDTETGLLYFADYDQEALVPCYPNCCQASDVSRCETKCSINKSLIPRRSNPYSTPFSLPPKPPKPKDLSEPTVSLTKSDAPKRVEIERVLNKNREQARLDQMESMTSKQDYASISELHSMSSNPSSIGLGTIPSQTQGFSTELQQSSSQIRNLQPRLKQVMVQETKTSDPVTRSLPPTRVKKLVPKEVCSSCQTDIIGFAFDCSAKCKVCVQCLVRSALPAKMCPGCMHNTLNEEVVELVEKLRQP